MQLKQSASAKKQKGERQKVVDAINEVFDRFQGTLAVTRSRSLRFLHALTRSIAVSLDEESMDSITDDGIIAFCEELGIDPQDPVILVLSWSMEAASMCDFTRAEFLRGFEKLDCQTMDDLKEKLPYLRAKLHDHAEFTHIYSVRSRL